MEEPIISPDGKFVWTGSDWAPTDASEELNKTNEAILLMKKELWQNTR